jgi:hypothetical protein
MGTFDDAEILRSEADDDRAERSRVRESGTSGGRALLAKTKTVTTYPTVANRFYACEIQGLLGTEAEGSTGTLAAGRTVYAYNLGATIPASGTQVLLTEVPYRWVFRHG